MEKKYFQVVRVIGNYKNCERCREKCRRKQQVMYHCDVCNCDIRKTGKARHEFIYRREEHLRRKGVKDV